MQSGMPQAPSTERSIRFGYHWGFWKQYNRVGRCIENGKNVSDMIHFLKTTVRPFWRDNETWQETWEELKRQIEEIEELNRKEKMVKLRREQLNMIVDLAFDNGLMVDEGIPKEHIDALERRE